MELTKKVWIGTSTVKQIWLMGKFCPQTSYQVSVFFKIAIFSISNMDFTPMWARACFWNQVLNEVVYLRCLLQHFLNHDFINQNKLQRLGTASQRPLPNCILPSSGVVRQSAAWGENKKCRPCLYFLRLFEYDSGSLIWLIILLAQNLNLV